MDPRGKDDAPPRPWVCVNFAMSADGKLALPDRTPVDISSEEDLLRVHRLRASCDAILVGVSTVLADDPKLHVSSRRVPDPPALLKVVLDASGRTPENALLLETPGRTLLATVGPRVGVLRERFGDRADVVAFGRGPSVDIPALLAHLSELGVKRLLVEGGGETIWSFISCGSVDELDCYVGPMIIGGDCSPTPSDGPGAPCLEEVVRLELVSTQRLGEGVWIRYHVTGRR